MLGKNINGAFSIHQPPSIDIISDNDDDDDDNDDNNDDDDDDDKCDYVTDQVISG